MRAESEDRIERFAQPWQRQRFNVLRLWAAFLQNFRVAMVFSKHDSVRGKVPAS